MKRFQYRTSQRQRRKLRMLLIGGCISFISSMIAGLIILINSTQNTVTKATGNEDGGRGISITLKNSQIVSEFTWESDSPLKATLGPDATSIDNGAHIATMENSNNRGLAPGEKSKGINMVIANSPLFEANGIDISIDYRGNEPESGSFICRGKSFNFGIIKGMLAISYQYANAEEKIFKTEEVTSYEVMYDRIFRTYRFVFSPTTGRAEIFVNSVAVWSKQFEEGNTFHWGNDDIIIGKNLTGKGLDEAMIDNLRIRVTNSYSMMAESLAYFTLETDSKIIKIHWLSADNIKVDYYTIERSENGTDYQKIATVPSTGQASDDYFYEDKSVSPGVLFYRIRQTLKNSQFIVFPASAIKLKATNVQSSK